MAKNICHCDQSTVRTDCSYCDKNCDKDGDTCRTDKGNGKCDCNTKCYEDGKYDRDWCCKKACDWVTTCESCYSKCDNDCSCDKKCYGCNSDCGCDGCNRCDENTCSICNKTCYQQASGCISCDKACHEEARQCGCYQACFEEARPCACDKTCYQFLPCSTCDGCNSYVKCSCDMTCYMEGCSQCHHANYSQPW